MVARELLETLRAVPEDEAEEVLKGVVRLSQDGGNQATAADFYR